MEGKSVAISLNTYEDGNWHCKDEEYYCFDLNLFPNVSHLKVPRGILLAGYTHESKPGLHLFDHSDKMLEPNKDRSFPRSAGEDKKSLFFFQFSTRVFSQMAGMAGLCFAPPLTFCINQTHNSILYTHRPIATRGSMRTRTISLALGHDGLGDFGARDPFPAEIETNFSDRVSNLDTEHRILIPNVAAMSLAQQECTPISHLQSPISEYDAQQLLRKVIGWRLVNEEGKQKLQCLWKLRDYECGVELVNRIFNVVKSTGHLPNLHLEPPNQVRAELWTSSIGGLSMNDFIVAAKIDEIKTSDLVPRKRAWA